MTRRLERRWAVVLIQEKYGLVIVLQKRKFGYWARQDPKVNCCVQKPIGGRIENDLQCLYMEKIQLLYIGFDAAARFCDDDGYVNCLG